MKSSRSIVFAIIFDCYILYMVHSILSEQYKFSVIELWLLAIIVFADPIQDIINVISLFKKDKSNV